MLNVEREYLARRRRIERMGMFITIVSISLITAFISALFCGAYFLVVWLIGD